jgi:putative ABC transport system permease protein
VTVREAIVVALQGLRANRLRSLLTMLGMIIGVASVIVLVGLGNGTSAKLNEQIQSLGTNLIGVFQSRGSVAQSGRSQPLTDADTTALQEAGGSPKLVTVTPVKQGSAVLRSGTQLWRTSIAGSSPSYLAAMHRSVSNGRFFTDGEVRTSTRVVVLGAEPVKHLFHGNKVEALGRNIRIGRQQFEVIGVLAENGQDDDYAVMPITTARNYLIGGSSDRDVDQIVIEATSQATVAATMDKVTGVLMQQHHVDDPDQKDFEVKSNLELLQQYTQITDVFTLFLSAIAAISLLVGGIGIMNIMLVTVTERTREIGIRKAVGARKRAILTQFLIESTLLAGMGGLIGAGVGIAVCLGGAALGTTIGSLAPPLLSGGSVVLAFSVSLAIGLFFGAYPANRAARMHPIDALRYE